MATSRIPPTTQKARPTPYFVSVVPSLIVFAVLPNRMLKKSANAKKVEAQAKVEIKRV
jgi:hypothetical protein